MVHRRIALLVEYDGTNFSGSQAQAHGRTVQDVLETAVRAFTGERLRVAFAGRTDAGVHAAGQVVALDTATAHDAATFRSALNHFLPDDAAVRRAAEVATDFDPRRDARSRVYRYAIVDGGERSPLRRRQAWLVTQQLDAGRMMEAAEALPRGARDWAAFAGPVAEDYSTVRTLMCCRVRRCGTTEDGAGQLTVTMEADGFLPRQVRRTAGALERAGAGALDPQQFAALVDGPPASVGPVAPPEGLTLMAVRYAPGTVIWDDDEDLPAE